MKYFLLFIQRHWLINTMIVFIAITILSLWPFEDLPSAPGSDKLHHIISYAALAFPVALRKPRLWLFMILFFLIYSGLIELVQLLVNRYGEWLDMVANITGLACGILLAEMAQQWVKRNRKE